MDKPNKIWLLDNLYGVRCATCGGWLYITQWRMGLRFCDTCLREKVAHLPGIAETHGGEEIMRRRLRHG